MDLTKNEKNVLLLLLDNGRISDVDIARKIGITSQAVGLIRKKLENEKFINGYTCQLDFKKIGFNVFTLVMLKYRNNDETDNITGVLRETQQIIFLCRSSVLSVLVAIFAFRNENEMEEYFKNFRKQYHKDFDIINFYSCSASNLMKLDSSQLFKTVLE